MYTYRWYSCDRPVLDVSVWLSSPLLLCLLYLMSLFWNICTKTDWQRSSDTASLSPSSSPIVSLSLQYFYVLLSPLLRLCFHLPPCVFVFFFPSFSLLSFFLCSVLLFLSVCWPCTNCHLITLIAVCLLSFSLSFSLLSLFKWICQTDHWMFSLDCQPSSGNGRERLKVDCFGNIWNWTNS